MDARDVDVATGRAETSEIEVTLELRRVLQGARGLTFALGPMGRVHAVRSTGVTTDGRGGSVRAAMPELGLGAGVSWAIARAAALQLDLSGGAMLGRRRMLLSGTEAFDLGTFAATARISLVIPGR
jgi:hypothetical protein